MLAGSAHGPRLAGWRWPLALAALTGLAVVVLETRVARLGGVGPGNDRLLHRILLWWVLLVPAVALLRLAARRGVPRRLGLAVVVLVAIALQAGALTRGSQISDDLYRYAWDGRVQTAGVDPYRYAPVAPELARFRDPWLWPNDATCTALAKRERPCTRINRPPVHTVYPPVAEAWFAAVDVLPGPPRDHHQQLWAGLASLGLLALLAAALARRGRDPLLVAAYGWSPLAGLDIASDAHVDVVAGLLGLAAVLVAERGWQAARETAAASGSEPSTSATRRPVLVGVLLGLATAVKIYPALLAPAVARHRPLRSLATASAVVLVVYLPHVLAIGVGVLGYLPGYLAEEQYAEGGRFLLLGLVGIDGQATQAVAVVLLLALATGVSRSHARPVDAAVVMLGGTFLVIDPVQPWYALTLVALAVVAGRLEWLAVCVAAYPLYFAALLHRDVMTVGRWSYGLALLVVALAEVGRRVHRRRTRRPATGPVKTPRRGSHEFV